MKKFNWLTLLEKALIGGATAGAATLATQIERGSIDTQLVFIISVGTGFGVAIRNFLKHYKKLKREG